MLLIEDDAGKTGNYCKFCTDVYDGDECYWCRDYRPEYERKLSVLKEKGFELDDVVDGISYYTKSVGDWNEQGGEWTIHTEVYMGCDTHYTFMYFERGAAWADGSVLVERDMGQLSFDRLISLSELILSEGPTRCVVGSKRFVKQVPLGEAL